MQPANKPKSLLIFYIIFFYILASFAWWAYQLFDNNREKFQGAKAVLWEKYQQAGIHLSLIHI